MRMLIISLLLTVCSSAIAAPLEQAAILDTPTGKIVGTLMLPKPEGRMPVAVIVAGSGPTDRNGNTYHGPRTYAQAAGAGAGRGRHCQRAL